MKNCKLLKIGVVCLFVGMTIGTYFWYKYFDDVEKNILSTNVRLELINNGKINYYNAIPEDLDEAIPTYYFRVRNNVDVPISYDILINDVSAEEANDGCSSGVLFTRDQLNYELFKDNKLFKSGKLSDLANDIITSDSMDGTITNDYALRIRLNENAKNTLGRHYHYVINIREIK